MAGIWAGKGAEQAKYPEALEKAAQAFKSADPLHRYHEAEKLQAVLPKCPVTFRTNTGIGEITSYDYSRPSYILTTNDVTKLLGAPFSARTNSDSVAFSYIIGKRERGDYWSMCIEFRSNHVVYDSLRGWLDRWDNIEKNHPKAKP